MAAQCPSISGLGRETALHCHGHAQGNGSSPLSERPGPRPWRRGRNPCQTSALTYRSSDVAGRSGKSGGSLRSLQRRVPRGIRGRNGGDTRPHCPGTRPSAPRHLRQLLAGRLTEGTPASTPSCSTCGPPLPAGVRVHARSAQLPGTASGVPARGVTRPVPQFPDPVPWVPCPTVRPGHVQLPAAPACSALRPGRPGRAPTQPSGNLLSPQPPLPAGP